MGIGKHRFLAVAVTVFLFLVGLGGAAHFTSSTNIPADEKVETGAANQEINFTVNNTANFENITEINVTLDANTTFLTDSNKTSIPGTEHVFSNTSTVLTWRNETLAGIVENRTAETVRFNVSVDGVDNGTVLAFNVSVLHKDNTVNWTWNNLTVEDTVAPAVTAINSPADGSTQSGTITLNSTVTDETLDTVQFNVTNSSGSQQLLTATNDAGDFWNATLDTTTLQDGNYNITTWANDTGANINNTQFVTITVDNAAPSSISFVNPTPADTANLSQSSVTVNVTFSDSNPDTCLLEWRNGTKTNFTMTRTGTVCNATLNNRGEGNFNYTVYINDTTGNLAQSSRRFVTLDRTSPSASVSASPSNTYPGASITVSCSSSDSVSGVESSSASVTKPSGTTIGGACGSYTDTSSTGDYSVSFTATDFAGNSNSASASFTIESSNGGGGGGTPTTTVPRESHIFFGVEQGKQYTAKINSEEVGVETIDFTAEKDANSVDVVVEKHTDNPADTMIDVSVERYLSITHEGLDTADISDVSITFHVSNDDWLQQHDADRVALHRLSDGTWNALPTQRVEERANTVLYRAESPSLSTFAVAEEDTAQNETTEESVCGDGVCAADETAASCPADCGTMENETTEESVCGDGVCAADETAASCPSDCEEEQQQQQPGTTEEETGPVLEPVNAAILLVLVLLAAAAYYYRHPLQRWIQDTF